MSYLQILMNAPCQTTAMVYAETRLEAISAHRALIIKNLIRQRSGVLHQLSNGIFFWVSVKQTKAPCNCNL